MDRLFEMDRNPALWATAQFEEAPRRVRPDDVFWRAYQWINPS